jgi:hypothetical protein
MKTLWRFMGYIFSGFLIKLFFESTAVLKKGANTQVLKFSNKDTSLEHRLPQLFTESYRGFERQEQNASTGGFGVVGDPMFRILSRSG